jgi:hypothetical protein
MTGKVKAKAPTFELLVQGVWTLYLGLNGFNKADFFDEIIGLFLFSAPK